MAQFKYPAGLAFDRTSGDIIVADGGNHAIRRVASDGRVTTLAGSGRHGDKDGVGSAAQFRDPRGVAVDSSGIIFITDTGNHKIRRIARDQRVTTIAGIGSPGDTDGAATAAKFHAPEGIAVAKDVLYVADTKNHRVRAIRSGVVSTVAGGKPGATDGSTAVAEFHEPSGIAVAHDGALIVGDARIHRIRSIRDGMVATIAGTGRPGYADADGNPLAAEFHEPRALAAEGLIVVADERNGAVRALYTTVRLDAVVPATANVSGGEEIRLSGDGFVPGATIVTVDGIAVPATYASPTELRITTPPHEPGAVTIEVTTPGGAASLPAALQYTVPYTNIVVRPEGATLAIGDVLQFGAFGVRANGSEEPVGASWATSDATVAEVSAAGLLTAVAPGSVTVTASFQGLIGTAIATVANPDVPPTDDTVDAPPVSQTTFTDFAEAVRFLYTGTNPVQTGVAEGTIERRRAAVVRGLVTDRNGDALLEVAITAVNRIEYGSTSTRSNGMFDLAVNGGDLLTIRYEKPGFLPVDRQVTPSWRDYTYVDDVVMVPLDSAVTPIESNGPANQVALGSPVTDDDGSRRTALLFRSGTSATMTFPDGTEQPLQTSSVRATEYSVGNRGPKAMPAPLPDLSGYTYCVELSVDEARAAGATSVQFSKPVITYVDNFLQFPAGGIVPSGYYDRTRATWVGSQNGTVIKILNVSGGAATLDTNGDGAADTDTILNAIGIDLAERQTLATLYHAGRTLWRVPVDHFTPWDFNWPYGPPAGAIPPSEPINWRPDTRDESSCSAGSIIECDNQALGETIPIVGTGMALHYRSTRVPGRTSANRVEIPITGGNVPNSLRRIQLEISVAGRILKRELAPAADLSHTFEWDGEDVFGRTLNGQQRTSIKTSYIYDAVYYGPQNVANAFAGFGNGVTVGMIGRAEFALSKTDEITLGAFHAKSAGLGGWTLTPHHAYDQEHGIIYYGDGTQRSATDSIGATVSTVVRKDGAIAVGGDGTLFLTQPDGIYGVSPLGEMTRIVAMTNPGPMALDGTGGIYVIENNRVLYVSPERSVTVVAGTGTAGFSGDNGPAIAARLNGPSHLAFHEGTLYIADYLNHRIRTMGRDCIIRTIAGGGFAQNTSGFAQLARLQYPVNVTASRDGVFFAHGFFGVANAGVYRIAPNGNMEQILGDPFNQRILSDGRGGLYLVNSGVQRTIQRVAGDEIRFVVGEPNLFAFVEDGDRPENTPAAAWSLALGPKGELYFTDLSDGVGRVRRLTSPLPGVGADVQVVASADGAEVYRFNDQGRHLTTEGALTGSSFHTFEYENDLLAAIVDADGNRVRIEREADGSPVAIVAPGGQRTVLEVDSNGYLSAVTNPAGETHRFTTSATGLLRAFRDPKSRLSEFTYSSDGRLESDRDPAGGTQRLSTAQLPTGQAVTLTSAEGHVRVNASVMDQDGADTRNETDWSGRVTTSVRRRDGSREVTTPTGLTVSMTESPDPRYQLQAPAHRIEVRTPGGLRQTVATTRQTEIDPATSRLIRLTTTNDINGRTSRSVYDAAAQTITTTSPLGRQVSVFLGAAERVTGIRIPGLAPIATGYEDGLLTAVAQGSRTWHFGYDGKRRIASASDPAGRTVSYGYDDAGRLTRQTFPDGRFVGFGYDAAGNITLVTPPGRPAHGFTTTPLDLVDTYTPPPVTGAGSTRYLYNRDRQLTTVIRPDGQQTLLGYDGSGRLQSVYAASQQIAYHYDSAGRLSQLSGGAVNLSYAYDGPLVRGVTMSGAVAGSIDVTYDDDFRAIREVVNTADISFGYDDDGLLVTAGALSLERQPATGFLAGTGIGQLRDAFIYNDFGEVTSYVAEYGTDVLMRIEYGRDDIGRITSRTETTPSRTDRLDYGYDRASRLTQVTRNGDVVSEYGYDANSNRTEHRFVGGSNTGNYDDQDRLLAYGTSTYTYTPNGERKTKTTAGVTTTYDYDGFGNLTRVTTPGRTIEYLLDAAHRRTGKSVNGALTQAWLYADQLRIVAELNGANQVVSRFVYGSRTNLPDYMIRNGATYRIVSDHLGSPRLVVDVATGTIAQTLEYDEFGNVLIDSNPGFQPFGFAGGLYDQDTALLRFGARDYDPHTGRWTTKDPILFDASGVNLYEYANGDPINLFDPSGLDPVTADPHVQELALQLWKKAQWGHTAPEVFAFIAQDPSTGAYGCTMLPMTYEQNQFTVKKGTTVPPNTIAVIHTHPNKRTSEPDDPGDVVAAGAFKRLFPSINAIYTISKKGIGKYVPGQPRGTQEETSLAFPNAATDGCSCTQAPRQKRRR